MFKFSSINCFWREHEKIRLTSENGLHDSHTDDDPNHIMINNLADDMESQFSLGGWGEVRTPTFDSYYALQEKLQSGSYGTVFVGLHRIRKKEYAIKVVDRR